MSFSTKNVDTTEKKGVSQFMTYGVQMAAITGLEVKESTNGSGKKMFYFTMESPKITDAGFEPHADAKLGGKIARIPFTIYMDNNSISQVEELLKNIGIIADKLGVREKVDAIEAADAENYLKAVLPLIRGKFAWWAITAEEYLSTKDDKIRYTLGLRRYGFIASMDEGEAHLAPFDKSNVYDYKPYVVASKDPDEVDPIDAAFGKVKNDLPWDE